MEHAIKAPAAGVVRQLHCQAGDLVRAARFWSNWEDSLCPRPLGLAAGPGPWS